MAKMFYTLEEVQARLAQSGEQIAQLVKDGKLREFRDGAKVLFKVDEVDSLGGADQSAASEDEIGLAPMQSAAGIPLAQDSADRTGLGDTAGDMPLAGDTDDSIGLVPGDSADRISLDDSGTAEKTDDDTVITTHGVDALAESDSGLEIVDPLAQTQVAPELDDQVHLDSGSSGSGLLDLTREADDTSLGAELLEEIYPGTSEGAVETQIPTQLDMGTDATAAAMDAQAAVPLPEYTRAAAIIDPASGAFGAMMIVPLLILVYMACVAAAAIGSVQPGLFETLTNYNWYVIGGATVLAVIIVLVGTFVAGAGAPGGPKPKKAKKTKPKAAAQEPENK